MPILCKKSVFGKRNFLGFFKDDFAKFALSEIVDNRLCRALVIGLIAFEFEAACHCDLLENLQRIVAQFTEIVAIFERVGIYLLHFVDKVEAKLAHVQNIFPYRADIRKVMRNPLILELAPQRARRVQKVNVVDGQPLLSARNARSVTRNRFCFLTIALMMVDFPLLGTPTTIALTDIFAPFWAYFQFCRQRLFESCHDLRAIARSTDCLYVRFSLSFKLFAPQIEVAFFNEIALVET